MDFIHNLASLISFSLVREFGRHLEEKSRLWRENLVKVSGIRAKGRVCETLWNHETMRYLRKVENHNSICTWFSSDNYKNTKASENTS